MMKLDEKLEILKAAALISDFGYGVWAYEKWAEFNRFCFDGRLSPGGIFWGLTPHGHALGFYERWRNAITLHPSLINQDSNAWGAKCLLGERFAADVLLHEMIHQYLRQVDDYQGESSHNCEAWCDQVNRLIHLLNISTPLRACPIKQKRIDKKVQWHVPPETMSRRQLCSFPHSLRPRDYYESSARELAKEVGLIDS